MAENKTKPTTKSVKALINSIEHDTRRKDAQTLLDMFTSTVPEKPIVWGDGMIGYGKYHYKSSRSSQEGDWFYVGFSPRKNYLALYGLKGNPSTDALLKKLGKHRVGAGCLYINKLADVDLDVLKRLIKVAYQENKKNPLYGC